MTRNDILKLRLSILFVREKFNFFNTLVEFKSALRKRFCTEYSLDEIESCLNELEDKLVEEPESIIEVPEDFEIK